MLEAPGLGYATRSARACDDASATPAQGGARKKLHPRPALRNSGFFLLKVTANLNSAGFVLSFSPICRGRAPRRRGGAPPFRLD